MVAHRLKYTRMVPAGRTRPVTGHAKTFLFEIASFAPVHAKRHVRASFSAIEQPKEMADSSSDHSTTQILVIQPATTPTSTAVQPPSGSPVTRNYPLIVLYTGACFCLLFTSFNLAQSLVTTLHPDDGSITLAVLYATYAIGCFAAPYCGQVTGVRTAMCLAASVYVVWVMGNIFSSIILRTLLSLSLIHI